MKQYKLAIVTLVLGGTQVFAQTLPDAIRKTDNERYEEAGKEFRSLVQQSGISVGDVYYFYGDNYFQSDDLDSAKIIWKKGLELDPTNALAMIGNAKSMWLSGNKNGANTVFEEVLKNTKRKNAEVIRQIASVYLYSPEKDLNQAVTLLNEAIKLEPKNQNGYLMLGDAQVELNPRNSTDAMKSYNQAGDINNNAKVFVRKAKIYQRAQNPKLADSLYNIAQTTEPNYAPAYRERAELNMRYEQVNQSIKNWEKYLDLNDSDYARYRYASSLFMGRKYDETIGQINDLHKKGFKNMYTERILAYSIFDQNEANKADSAAYVKGWQAMEGLFKLAPEDKLIPSDYKYKAMYYEKMNQPELYVKEMTKIAESTPTAAKDIYGNLAKYYVNSRDYDNAIVMYNKKMAGDSTNLSLAEYYDLARAYYFGPKDFQKVDQAHAYILKLSPEYAMSFLWRARANVNIDLEKTTWAAKPYYEGFLGLLKDEEKAGQYKNMTIEALKYLGDYYVNSPEKNIDKAKEVWGEVQTLNPEDQQAIMFFKTVK